jgi:polyhydroxybutyrate depolymerase
MTSDESVDERRLLDELAELHRAERAPDMLRARLVARLSREPAPRRRARWALPALAAVVLGVVVSGLFAGQLLERRAGPELSLRAEPSAERGTQPGAERATAPGAARAPVASAGCPDYPGARDAAALLRTTEREVLLAGLAVHAVEQSSARCGVLQRRYLSYVPPSLPRRSSVPVLLVLHGATDDAERLWAFQTRRRFDELASRNSFIVIYPSALPVAAAAPSERRWLSGGDGTIDDERYLQLIVGDLQRREVIAGSNDVYLVGHAEGAVMALQAVAHRPDLYAGAAALMPDVAVAPPALSSTDRLSKVLLVTQGELGAGMGAEWALALGVPRATVNAPLQAALPDRVKEGEGHDADRSQPRATEGSTVESRDMSTLDGRGARVRVLAVHGAGRLWPNPLPDDARSIEAHGLRNQDFDGADEAWRFFSGRGRAAPLPKDEGAPAPGDSRP